MPTPTLHTQQISAGSRVVAIRRAPLRVLVLRGPDRKKSGDFDGDRVTIGTHPSCDFVLNDPTVSRQHCEIILVPGGYLIRDLQSRNGTSVGTMRITEVRVPAGLELQVGDSTIRLQPLNELREIPLVTETEFGPLRGQSAAMRRVFELLRRVAPTESTVLLLGESGTGKEVAARAIHEASPRQSGPFRVVDCGALPSTLAESELFGHVRGAFTGAQQNREGAFEAARGGTLFLDEIGELTLELQVKLLGALERRKVRAVGAEQLRDVDIRVVAATNRDLRQEVNRSTFREDLYFRLAVVTVHLPPLRDRLEDIPLYVEAFLDELGAKVTFDEAHQEKMRGFFWSGNVRELRNYVARYVALGESLTQAESSPDRPTASEPTDRGVDPATPFKVAKGLLVHEFERDYVEKLMARHQNNISQAARAAEIDRMYLLRLLDKHGLRPRR